MKKQTPSRTKPKRNFKFEYFDFSIHKDIRKMLRTAVINYIKMKICYDTCFIDIGVAMATQWRHFVFNLPLYFLVPGVFSEIITVQVLIRRDRWIKAPKTYLYRVSLEPVWEQGWRGGESTGLPPTMWPGFKCQRRLQMWVEFVVGSLTCSDRFFYGYSGFPFSSKTSTSTF